MFGSDRRFTGLRMGELRGLTWDSYQPPKDEHSLGWLNVTRSVWRGTVGEPMTAKMANFSVGMEARILEGRPLLATPLTGFSLSPGQEE
jgi:hypothetical protein